MSHSRCGQTLRMELPTSDQSSSLIWAWTSAHMRAVVMGLASQPSVASDLACSIMARRAGASFLPRASRAGLRPSARTERDDLGALLGDRTIASHYAVAELVEHAPQVVHLQRQDDVGLCQHRA